MRLSPLFQQAQQLQIVREVDLALLDLIQRQQDQALSDSQSLAVLLASRHSAMGHVCVDLAAVMADPLAYFGLAKDERVPLELLPLKRGFEGDLLDLVSNLTLVQWLADIQACQAVAVMGASHGSQLLQGAAASTPLVLELRHQQSLLYLRRYWQCEQVLANFIIQRGQFNRQLPPQAKAIIDALYTGALPEGELVDWQRAAVALSAPSQFAIITGGPGTGKTTTVLRLLALLQALQLAQQLMPLHIKLAAPTGKAAARLNESIAGNLQRQQFPAGEHYDASDLRMAIPSEVTTLHRLLGTVPNSRQFRHHANNPLAADVVVIDEASMVDIEMMAALVQALDAHTRLILIGDKDQLASVEAGSVLGDLCADAQRGHYLPQTQAWLQAMSGDVIPQRYLAQQASALAQTTTMLRTSHRFQQGGSIHALASLVNEGLYNGQPSLMPLLDLHAIVQQEQSLAKKQKRARQLQLFAQTVAGVSTSGQWLTAEVTTLLTQGYAEYLQLVNVGPQASSLDQWGRAVLTAHGQFQLLVALRQGQWGVDGMNDLIQDLLRQAGYLSDTEADWYAGRPVMVSRNDYHLKLMNGDMGVCLPYADSESGDILLRVVFSDGAGGVRWVLPSRLRAVETVFAMTVHKSQGSEFDHTLLMLPDRGNPVLTKELLYTGITRAKHTFSLIYGNEQILEQTMTKKVVRASGLMNRLAVH
ncbi:MAG: exodeoxyribonuclease V subunit alpha [Gammaproteobacteria bacterium]|jgi:exodeoxyribonuclease V alpha subunit|nr:exodeoxyribonuclease V subunit alpha [Gammaproteobacteria bacterium]